MDGVETKTHTTETGKRRRKRRRRRCAADELLADPDEETSVATDITPTTEARAGKTTKAKRGKAGAQNEEEKNSREEHQDSVTSTSCSDTQFSSSLETFGSDLHSERGEIAELSIVQDLATVASAPDFHVQPHIGALDPFEQDEEGDTLLHLAVIHRNADLTWFLITKMKPRLDIYNNMRQTPLHLAVITKNTQMIKLLLLSGASANVPDRHGQTSVHLAVKTRDPLYTQTILETLHHAKHEIQPVDLEIRNFEGYTSLHLATLDGLSDVIEHLIAHGANIEAKDSKSGRTCLHHAVEANNQPLVQFLLERGANVNAKTHSGNIALHTASGRNLQPVMNLLLQYGSDVNYRNAEGDCPKAIKKGRPSKEKTTTKKATTKTKK